MARATTRTTTSICTRLRLKQPLHRASQPLHDARCMSEQPQLARKRCAPPLSHSGSVQIPSGGDAATRSQHPFSRRSDATVLSRAKAARESTRTTTSICTRLRLKQPPPCASQPLHDAQCMSEQPQLARNRCAPPLSHSGSVQIPSGGEAATRSQHPFSRRSDATVLSRAKAARATTRTTTSIYTRLRLKQPPPCASQPLHDARCMSEQPQLARKRCAPPLSHSGSVQIQEMHPKIFCEFQSDFQSGPDNVSQDL
eukprot:COSAG02_NODE_205_length_29157_cov_13.424771_19_plen_255_part_00